MCRLYEVAYDYLQTTHHSLRPQRRTIATLRVAFFIKETCITVTVTGRTITQRILRARCFAMFTIPKCRGIVWVKVAGRLWPGAVLTLDLIRVVNAVHPRHIDLLYTAPAVLRRETIITQFTVSSWFSMTQFSFVRIIIIFYLPKKEASYQKSRSSSYAGRPLYNNS